MVGYLKGKIISKSLESNQCILLAHRVGYEVVLPLKLLNAVEINSHVSLWIHSHVREDAFTLFGFSTEAEKNLFRVLLGMSGLGPKTALSLLNEHGAQRLCQLVLAKDTDRLSDAPGVGKKLAQKMVLDLTTKIEKIQWLTQLTESRDSAKAPIVAPGQQLREDLSSALLHLGYLPQQIKNAMEKLFERPDVEVKSFETLLKEALKELSGRPHSLMEAANA